jgi:hypothetical protein
MTELINITSAQACIADCLGNMNVWVFGHIVGMLMDQIVD